MRRHLIVRPLAGLSLLLLFGCAGNDYGRPPARTIAPQAPSMASRPVPNPTPTHATADRNRKPATRQEGEASFYGDGFEGRETASGTTFRKDALTAASPTLPLGSTARVTNKETGKSVKVKINDRMPTKTGRVIDLSEAAAERVGITDSGTAPVRIEAKH